MQNFRNLGASGGGDDPFLTKPPKGTSLADFTHFELLRVQIPSGFFLQASRRKKGHYKKSQRGYISSI